MPTADPRQDANAITGSVVDAAIEVHRALGPGLLESAYQAALLHELQLRGLRAAAQVPMPLRYKDLHIERAYVADAVIEDIVIIEVKATEGQHPLHARQLLTYLKASGLRFGLLLNFGQKRMVDGIERVVHGY